MENSAVKSASASGKSSGIKILIILCLLVVIIFLVSILQKISNINNNAESLGAKIDWQAVFTNSPPFYLIQYKAVRIQFEDVYLFKKKISETGIELDLWEGYEHEVIAGASMLNIQKLEDNGLKVTVLADSYTEYFNSPESKVYRGNPISGID